MRRRVFWMVPLAIAFGVACSDSTGVAGTDLVGTWNATQFVFSDFGDPVMDFDVIATGGGMQITFRADSTFTTIMTMPVSLPDTTEGTWSLPTDTRLILTDEGSVDGTELEVSLSGSTLTVHSTDVDFDFGNGNIPAQLNAKFVKQ